MTKATSSALPTTAKVGDLIEGLPVPVEVSRPNGDTITVGDGLYYADTPGVHVIYDGTDGGHQLRVS